ncbi:MAG: thioredoxin family protein [Cyclobacteriaceae bacterium]
MELKATLSRGYNRSITYPQYVELVTDLAANGGTTGDQKDDLINFTKLNAQRSKRITKTVKLEELTTQAVKHIQEAQTWLVISESWCGDAANSLPMLAKMADENELINLRVVLRDEDTELIDTFLTRGGRSIPKLIALDGEHNVLFTWGPRPSEAQKLYDDWRNDPDHVPYAEFQITMQQWYNQNKGVALQQELTQILMESND